MTAQWSSSAARNVRRALAAELRQLLEGRLQQLIDDLPDHCRECGERIDMAPGWTCILNGDSSILECTYAYRKPDQP